MKINIQFVNIATSETLEDYTKKKLDKLDKKYDQIIHVDVFFEKENNTKGDDKVCKMELSLYGPRLFASAKAKNYELAVKQVLKDLEKQLDKRQKTLKPYL